MDIRVVINGVFSLFIIILIGFLANKKNIISKEMNQGLSQFLLKITLPLMVLSSFSVKFDSSMKSNVIKAFFYSIITMIITIVVAYIFLKPLKTNKKFLLQFATVFSNCGFIGFPIINSIYGAEGVIYASIFNMIFTISVWTYGLVLFTGKLSKKEIKNVLLNPAIIAVYLGIVLIVFNLTLPTMVLTTIELVGSITSPLSMIIIGVILANVDIRKFIKDWQIYYMSFLKLILIPGVLFLLFKIVKVEGIVSNTMIILSALPTAAITSIFAESFQKEAEYAAVLVFITTLFSLIAFPLLVAFIA